jgi:type III secretion protein N (ATPase)
VAGVKSEGDSVSDKVVGQVSSLTEAVRHRARRILSQSPALMIEGKIWGIRGDLVIATIPIASIGQKVIIERKAGPPVACLIVGAEGQHVFLSPFDELVGVEIGAVVRVVGHRKRASTQLLGPHRIIDALGVDLMLEQKSDQKRIVEVAPRWRLDDREEGSASLMMTGSSVSVASDNSENLERAPTRFETGIRSIDGLLPLAEGQRVAIVAPPGCGKTCLLLQLAEFSSHDALVVALVGERRREIREFAARLRQWRAEKGGSGGGAGQRTIVIAEPSDASPMRRLVAAFEAVDYAERLAREGKRVVLMIDSLTRVARAMREVGLMRGERIVRGGYTASVYIELPRLLERAGPQGRGVITAFYALLSHDERDIDPLKEEVLSLLDGHIVLSESLSRRGIYPAIHPTQSLSRMASAVETPEERQRRLVFIQGWERLERDRDTVLLGGRPDPELKRLLRAESSMAEFLSQSAQERISREDGVSALAHVLSVMG